MAVTKNRAIEEIKDRIDIIEIISDYVTLKKNGRNYWGLCPFHGEKTPSFSVNAEKGIFKCFGCGVGGDAISFLMQHNNQSFMEVMADLAVKYGIELDFSDNTGEGAETKKLILKANSVAKDFYVHNLDNTSKAFEYLEKRRFEKGTLDTFMLGVAPDKYDALYNYLTVDEGFDAELLEKAGLTAKRSDGKGYVDKFKNRIIIPIADEKGNIVAFGARIFNNENAPKYLNSQETIVYNKSRTLYGLYQAKESIRQNDSVVIMEGYFDVITAHSNGITNAVASCGTSLTEGHIKVLSKYTDSKRIYLAFDSDSAGVKATQRSAELVKEAFSPLGDIKQFDTSFAKTNIKNEYACEIRVVQTNSSKDPDEFIRENGGEVYRECIENAPLLIDFQINSVLDFGGKTPTPQEKLQIVKDIAPILVQIKNRIIFEEYINRVSLKLDIDKTVLYQEIRLVSGVITSAAKSISGNVTISSNKLIMCQKNLLSLYFINSNKIPVSWLAEKIKEANFTDVNLLQIKETVEKLSTDIADVDELIKLLMTEFEDSTEVKKELADIIYSIDDKVELPDNDLLDDYIYENILSINKLINKNTTKKLESSYHNVNDDDKLALELQQKVMEQLKRR
ncbi:MAG: DNA primase [Candidatus Gastranaerophilales bacterium]|nr:DNA primase [Candidatus Gastranaerophilales bacterium]